MYLKGLWYILTHFLAVILGCHRCPLQLLWIQTWLQPPSSTKRRVNFSEPPFKPKGGKRVTFFNNTEQRACWAKTLPLPRINKASKKAHKPVCRRCTTCAPAACWSPPLFPLTLACLERMPRCHHTADTPGARCCGTAGIRHYMTGRHGARCHVASATPAALMSGLRLRPRCEEPKGHLEKNDYWRLRDWHWKYMFPMSLPVCPSTTL